MRVESSPPTPVDAMEISTDERERTDREDLNLQTEGPKK